MNKRIIVMAAAMLALCAGAAAAAGQDTIVESKVQPAFFNSDSPGWVPLLVKLTNKTDKTLDLVFIADAYHSYGTDSNPAFTSRTQVSLSPKTTKQFYIYVYTDSSSVKYSIHDKAGSPLLLEPFYEQPDEGKVFEKMVEGLSLANEWRDNYNVLFVGGANSNALEEFNSSGSFGFQPDKLSSVSRYSYSQSSNGMMSAKGQAAYVGAAESLPDLWVAYSSTDVIILNGGDMSAMSSEQKRAITDYVRMGGTLVISPPNKEWLLDPRNPVHDLIARMDVTEMEGSKALEYLSTLRAIDSQVPSVSLLDIKASGARNVMATDSQVTRELAQNKPNAVVAQVVEINNGRVFILPFDMSAMGGNYAQYGEVMKFFLQANVFREPKLIFESHYHYYYSGMGPNPEGPLIKSAIARALDLGAKRLLPLSVLTLLAIGYVILVAPVNFLMLRRWRRPMLFAASVPIIVVAYTMAIFITGYLTKGVTDTYAEISVIEATSGSPVGACERFGGIYSAHPGGFSFDYSGRTVPCPYFLNGNMLSDTHVEFAARPDAEQSPAIHIENFPLGLWQMGYVNSTGPRNLDKGVTIEMITGGCVITNNSPYDLERGVLIVPGNSSAYAFPGARKGQRVLVEFLGNMVSTNSLDLRRLLQTMGHDPDDTKFDWRALDAAVYERVRQLGSGGDPVLIAEFEDPGLPFTTKSWMKKDDDCDMQIMMVRLPRQ